MSKGSENILVYNISWKKSKRDLLIGIIGGFVTGVIFLAGDGIAELATKERGLSLTCANRIKVGAVMIMFAIIFIRIKTMKK